MNNNRDSRFRIRFVLLTIILTTLPCYCTGLALVRFAGGPQGERATPTPIWAQFATQSAATASALAPSFTPFYVTATQVTPFASPSFEIPPTWTFPPSATPSPPPSPTATPTQTLVPSDTPAPLPSETLPPTVTFTATEPAVLPTDTGAPPAPIP